MRWIRVLVLSALVLTGATTPGEARAGLAPSTRFCMQTSGQAGALAVINLTPVSATAPGNGLLVSSDVVDPPLASNVNYMPGSFDPNLGAAPIGDDGAVCFLTSSTAGVELVADFQLTLAPAAYMSAAGDGTPVRVADTRVGIGGTRLARSGRLCMAVAGAPGDLAVVNLTPVLAAGPGNGVLITSDATVRPVASSVNFALDTVDPNLGAALIGQDGRVCFLNSAHHSVDLVADHLFTMRRGNFTMPTATDAPRRVADTRIGLAGNRLAPGARVCMSVSGAPNDFAVVNLTPVGADGPGNGVLIDSDPPSNPFAVPLGSNVNFAPGTVDPNVAVAQIGDLGTVCFQNSEHASVDLVADQLFTIGRAAVLSSSMSRVDTRSADFPTAQTCVTDELCVGAAGSEPATIFMTSIDEGATWSPSASVPRGGWQPGAIFSINCASSDYCVALANNGYFSPASGASGSMFVMLGSPYSWREAAPGVGVDAFVGADCPSANACLVAGRSCGPYCAPAAPFVTISSGDGSWESIELPPGAHELQSIGCPAPDECFVSQVGGPSDDFSGFIRTTDDWQTWTVE